MTTLLSTPGIPLYVQIREQLRQAIADGILEPGQKIASEEELAEQFGVSRMTARQGIMELISEGLLFRRHGVGTFVAQSRIDRDHSRLTNFFEDPKVENLHPSLRLLSADVVPAPSHVAKVLNIDPGDNVYHIRTLRIANDQVVTLHSAYYPSHLFPGLLDEDLSSHHVWHFIENRYGYKLKEAIQKLEARAATQEQAELLEVEVEEPVLYKERTVFAEDGTVVEFSECHNRADRYTCTVLLQR